MRTNMPLPRAIENAPELWPGLELYLKAWYDLDTTRSIGFGVGPIPWHAVEAYCSAHNMDEMQRARMHYMIREMDKVYLDHANKR